MSSGTTLDAELLFWLRQHRGRWAVFSAAFHHAERAPRVTSSPTAESPTIRSFSTILGVDIRILATRVRRTRKTRKLFLLLADVTAYPETVRETLLRRRDTSKNNSN